MIKNAWQLLWRTLPYWMLWRSAYPLHIKEAQIHCHYSPKQLLTIPYELRLSVVSCTYLYVALALSLPLWYKGAHDEQLQILHEQYGVHKLFIESNRR